MVVFLQMLFFYLISSLCLIFGVYSASVDVATTLSPKVKALLDRANVTTVKDLLKNSRRILNGREAGAERPYMVYLKLKSNSGKAQAYKKWLCGGVIIHEEYILTSAACIEDVKHFYIVAGTTMYSADDDIYTNQCIKNGARKAVWKCTPKNYVFEGHENDNIRWMSNDIAVVKVDEEFDFTRKVKGCDFIPKPICYNNQSLQREAPDTMASVAGWGSTEKYNDWVTHGRREMGRDSVALLEADVTIIEKSVCKRRWGSRYHKIIDNYMICTKDLSADLSTICQEKYVDCVDIDSDELEDNRRSLDEADNGVEHLHSAHHNLSASRRDLSGGFCENDHGGPLVVGHGFDAMVVGIISACLVKEKTNKCYGPFLYTSVYQNRVLINCAIYKNVGNDCTKNFRSGATYVEEDLTWVDHPDGPSKHDIRRRLMEEEGKLVTTGNAVNNAITVSSAPSVTAVKSEAKVESKANVNVTNSSKSANVSDKILEHSGLVLRSHPK